MKKCFLLVFLLICMAINAQQKLPIIKLSGDFGYEYQDGIVSIIYPDGSSQDSLTAHIKWRGGTTNADDKHKRNYKIKFTDDHRFLDYEMMIVGYSTLVRLMYIDSVI